MPENSDFQFDVFLSHSAKDKMVVRSLAERLRQDGLTVWFDEWVLKPGDSIPAKIEEGLEHSRVLVLCMSANAFGSDWARLEAGTFRFRDPLNQERRFIPLRLDDAPITGSLAQFLYINWGPANREEEYAKLLEACRPLWKSATEEIEAADEQAANKTIQLGAPGAERASAYAFNPNGTFVLTGRGTTVRLWEVKTGRCLHVLKGHTQEIISVAWSPDGHRVLSGSGDTTIRMWDVKTQRCLRVFDGHDGTVWSVAMSPDGRSVLSGSLDRTLRLWDAETGRCLRVLDGHTGFVLSAAWSPDGHRALSGSADNTLRLWDVETGRCLRILEGHANWVEIVAWSPDGHRALSGSNDKTVRLWDVETGRCLRILESHGGVVGAVAWSPDGHRALSGSNDETVRLWDVETGRCLRVLRGRSKRANDAILYVAWTADQRHSFAGNWSNTRLQRS